VRAKLRELLRKPKDAALAFGLQGFVNVRLRGIGEMTDISIDTKKRTIRLRLQLAGESKPVEILVRKYSVKRRGDGARLLVEDAAASRKWIEVALREFVVGRSFTIPARAAALLKLLT
jgi:hypothetical protein